MVLGTRRPRPLGRPGHTGSAHATHRPARAHRALIEEAPGHAEMMRAGLRPSRVMSTNSTRSAAPSSASRRGPIRSRRGVPPGPAPRGRGPRAERRRCPRGAALLGRVEERLVLEAGHGREGTHAGASMGRNAGDRVDRAGLAHSRASLWHRPGRVRRGCRARAAGGPRPGPVAMMRALLTEGRGEADGTHRYLGRTGLRVSALSFGTMTFGGEGGGG